MNEISRMRELKRVIVRIRKRKTKKWKKIKLRITIAHIFVKFEQNRLKGLDVKNK